MSGQVGGFSPVGGGAPLGMDFDEDVDVGLLVHEFILAVMQLHVQTSAVSATHTFTLTVGGGS